MSIQGHMHWSETLMDPEHKDRTAKIIDIILMQSCEFVSTINVNTGEVHCRFMSDLMHEIAPHWNQNEAMDFYRDMRDPLSKLVKEEFKDEMLKTFSIPYIVEKLNEKSPYITTFTLVPDATHVFPGV